MELEFFSAAFLSALFAIVLIDLVLAGDNALIIGLVARNLPKDTPAQGHLLGHLRRHRHPRRDGHPGRLHPDRAGLHAGRRPRAGLDRAQAADARAEDAASHLAKAPAATFAGAVRTIVMADAVMGVDNVLAIGGAASGSILLIVLGLAISVPIIVWGSHLVIKLVDRYPVGHPAGRRGAGLDRLLDDRARAAAARRGSRLIPRPSWSWRS